MKSTIISHRYAILMDYSSALDFGLVKYHIFTELYIQYDKPRNKKVLGDVFKKVLGDDSIGISFV